MNVMQIINIPVINAIVQILLAMLVMIIINPHLKHPFRTIITLSILTEFVMDGFNFINKSITHNIFFVVYFPLSLFFAGYVYRIKRLQIYALLLLGAFLTYFTMDAAIEHDWLRVWYPVSTQYYVWHSGTIVGVLILTFLVFLLNSVEKRISGKRGIIQLPFPLPSHIGTLSSRKSYRFPS